ncbi:MAG: ABC transporter ATP-binding protein [Alphaproteobacteria bacterium]|nr:ABC transporter ATP-binding protein [Alphaproteobacteria bacterium]
MNRSTEAPANEKTLITRDVPFFWRLVKLSWKYPLTVAMVSILAMLSDFVSIGLLVPFLQALMGGGIGARMADTPLGFLTPFFSNLDQLSGIRWLALAIICTTLLRVGLTYGATLLNFRFQVDVERRVRKKLFDAALFMNFDSVNKSRLSDIFFILNNLPSSVSYSMFTLVSFLPAFLSLALFSTVVLLVSWQLTVLGMGLFAMTYFLVQRINRQIRKNARDQNTIVADLHHTVMECVNGLSVIRPFTREDWAAKRYADHLASYIRALTTGVELRAKSQPIHSLASTFSLALILFFGTFVLTVDGQIWSEMIVLYLIVMARLSGPVSTILRLRSDLAAQAPGIAQVADFLRANKPQQNLAEGKPFPGIQTNIRLEHVSFSYSGNGMAVLDDVSLTLENGKTLALVGASGSGKSTLIKLLARFYSPTQGVISCNGMNIEDFEIASWRKSIGIVSQSTFLFNDTIRENIRFGKLEADDQQVEEAAKLAHAHDFILETEQGYDTLVGDRGVRLSGGQAQRIAIARALLANPSILILDEATSALDAVSEQHVQEALAFLCQDRTVLVIAHRLATIRNADHIVVLENGRVAEEGSYSSLFERRGTFWNYARLQHLSDDNEVAEPLLFSK